MQAKVIKICQAKNFKYTKKNLFKNKIKMHNN